MISENRLSNTTEASPPETTRRSVLVVEKDRAVLERLAEPLARSYKVLTFSHLADVREVRLTAEEVVLFVLGPSAADLGTLDRLGALTRSRAGLGAVLAVEGASPELLRNSLRAGVDDAIELDRVEVELLDAVNELWAYLERDRRASTPTPGIPDVPGPKAQLTTVFSPKGGVGKSVVAVNLAAALARGAERPVAILDLDLQFGDVAVMLRLQPAHTIVEAAAAGQQLDTVLLGSLVVRHEASGVLVLAAPTTPSAADQIHAKEMLRVLSVLREMCSHVIIDTAPHLSEILLQAVAESDDVVYVVGMDVPSVKNARLGLQVFELLQMPPEKVVLLLNRADSKVHLAVRDVERSLGKKVDITLPSDALVPQSVNEGRPALLAYPKSRFTARIDELARLLVARAAERAKAARTPA